MSVLEYDDCLHPGEHVSPPCKCIECGRFSSHSWDTGWFYTPDGAQQHWGGICKIHGEWSESAA